MTTKAYLLRALSNMHPGSGDTNYGVIDNLVQRDPVTGLPVIHSSSLKGAIREHFVNRLEEKAHVDFIFGAGTQKNGDKNANAAGSFDFDQAYLLSIPMRSDKVQYISVTTQEIILERIERLQDYQVEGADALIELLQPLVDLEREEKDVAPWVFHKDLKGAIVEETDFEAKKIESPYKNGRIPEELEALFGKNIAIVRHQDFLDLTEQLPVIARNQLDNGLSKNLWYEEIVPRESRFLVFISEKEREGLDFAELICRTPVQIGANASVGYGLTTFNQIPSPSTPE